MGALLKFIVTIPFLTLLFWLSFANRDSVMVTWSPVHEPASVAVAVLLLAAVAIGFFWGAVMTWLNYAPLRRVHRQNKKTVSKLEKELTVARTQIVTAPSTTLSISSPQNSSQTRMMP